MSELSIRPATEPDVPLILCFVRELAEYEKLSHAVTATEALLRTALFGERPAASALIGSVDGEPAGFALFFSNFSTFLGRSGLYLEDLYVRPEYRGKGLGMALVRRVAAIAAEQQCGRLEWSVLNWNEPAIRFYQKLGAAPLREWTVFRLHAAGIHRLAGMDDTGRSG